MIMRRLIRIKLTERRLTRRQLNIDEVFFRGQPTERRKTRKKLIKMT